MARASVPRHVVHREFPAETVVLNLETGLYHGLNPVAGHMLRVLEASPSVGDAIRALQNDFPDAADRIEHDVLKLCGELAEWNLIELEPPAGR